MTHESFSPTHPPSHASRPVRPSAVPTPPSSTLTTAMLNDLLNNTLDPGYRMRAAVKKGRSRWDGPVLWLVCALVGLLLITAYQQTHRSAPARETARQDLIQRIRALQSAGTTMDTQAKALAAQVASLRDAQLPKSDSTDLRNLEIAAGGIAVQGPGVTVTTAEPVRSTASPTANRPGTGSQRQDAVIQDYDIRAVVNQLWLAGAEAVAVNGIRLTATTAIRFAGDAILVDFQTLSSPYKVEAVGDRDRMLLGFADSAIARRLKTEQAVYGISFSFSGQAKLSLPSVTVVQQSYATPGIASAGPHDTQPGPSAPTTTEPPR